MFGINALYQVSLLNLFYLDLMYLRKSNNSFVHTIGVMGDFRQTCVEICQSAIPPC